MVYTYNARLWVRRLGALNSLLTEMTCLFSLSVLCNTVTYCALLLIVLWLIIIYI